MTHSTAKIGAKKGLARAIHEAWNEWYDQLKTQKAGNTSTESRNMGCQQEECVTLLLLPCSSSLSPPLPLLHSSSSSAPPAPLLLLPSPPLPPLPSPPLPSPPLPLLSPPLPMYPYRYYNNYILTFNREDPGKMGEYATTHFSMRRTNLTHCMATHQHHRVNSDIALIYVSR